MVDDIKQVYSKKRELVWIYGSNTAELQAVHALADWSHFLITTSYSSVTFSPLPFVSEFIDSSFLNCITKHNSKRVIIKISKDTVTF